MMLRILLIMYIRTFVTTKKSCLLIINDSCLFIHQAGWTALHYSAWRGEEDGVRLLLEEGANIDAVNKVTFDIMNVVEII
jgi:hypothetical protein